MLEVGNRGWSGCVRSARSSISTVFQIYELLKRCFQFELPLGSEAYTVGFPDVDSKSRFEHRLRLPELPCQLWRKFKERRDESRRCRHECLRHRCCPPGEVCG